MGARLFDDLYAEDNRQRQADNERQRTAALQGTANPEVAALVAANRKKYPWMTPGAALSLAQGGYGPDSPVAAEVAKRAANRKVSKGLGWHSIGDVVGGAMGAASHVVKPVSRAVFTGLESGYQELQGVFRGATVPISTAAGSVDPAAASQRAQASGMRQDLRAAGVDPGLPVAPQQQVTGEGFGVGSQSTAGIALGRLSRGEHVDLGTGFFPGGDVREEQIQRARRSALIDGHAVTPGRLFAHEVSEPGTTEYNLLSGLVDAAAITYLDPANKLLGGASKLREGHRLFTGGEEIAPRTRRLLESAGVVTGVRKTTLPEVADQWLSGTDGRKVVNYLVGQDDFYSVWKTLGGKVDAATSAALADARTEEEVRNILRPKLGIEIREKPYLANPLTRPIKPVGGFTVGVKRRLDGVRLLHTMPGSHIDLEDVDQAVSQLDRFLHNAKAPKAVIAQRTGDLARATNRIEAYAVIGGAMDDVAGHVTGNLGGFSAAAARDVLTPGTVVHASDLDNFGRVVGVGDEAATVHFKNPDTGAEATIDLPFDQLSVANAQTRATARKLTKIFRNYHEELARYFVDELGNNVPILGATVKGADHVLPSPHLFNEYINRTLPLPNARDIRRTTSTWGRVLNYREIGDTGVAFLDFVQQDMWKPLALIRGAWTARVVGEEQVRMGASGLDSMVHHPLSALAWVTGREGRIGRVVGRVADAAAGTPLEQVAPKVGRGATDLLGEAFDAGDDLDEFAQAMSRKGGGWRDRVIHFGKTVHYREDPEFAHSWADELGQLNGDPVARRVAGGWTPGDKVPGGLTGNHTEDAKRWFWDGPGKKFRQQIGQAEGREAILDDRAVADAYIDTIFDRIQVKTGGRDDLLTAVASGKVDNVSIRDGRRMARPFVDNLRALADDAIGPEAVKGDLTLAARTTPGDKIGAKLDRGVDFMFSALMSKPTNKLSRSPAFRQYYWRRAEELLPFMTKGAQEETLRAAEAAGLARRQLRKMAGRVLRGTGELELEHADQVAKGFALDQTKHLLYDLSEKSQFFDIARHFFPFGEAWKEVLTRWAKIGWERPETLRKAQITINGAHGSGFFHTDPQTGEEMFSYPGSSFVTEKLAGVPVPMQGSVAALNLFSNNPLLPGFGPVVQYPAGKLIPDKPEWDWLKKAVVPYGEQDIEKTGLVETFLPPWVQKWRQAIGKPTDQRLFNNTVFDVARYLVSTGKYDTSTDAGKEKLEDAARDMAKKVYAIRGAAQFFVPAAPSPKFLAVDKEGDTTTAFRLIDRFHQLQQEDFNTATERFLNEFGEQALLFMQAKTQGHGPVNKAALDWVRENPDVARRYPETYGFFAPQGDDFDHTAYQRLIENGEIKALTVDEMLDFANHRVASMVYRNAKEKIGLRPSDEQRAWLRQVRDALIEAYPGYEPVPRDQGKLDRTIRELTKAAQDPVLGETGVGQATALYLAAREKAQKSAEAAGLSSFRTAKKARPLRDWLRQVAAAIEEEYSDFAEVNESIFDRELADDAEDQAAA